MAAADGPALLAAAVKAAISAKAPRRTVQAVAAAVAGVFARPAPACVTPSVATKVRAETGSAANQSPGTSAEELVDALRLARRNQRRLKKQRRREQKQAQSSAAAQAPEASMQLQDDASMMVPQSPTVGETLDDVPGAVVLKRGPVERSSPASPPLKLVKHTRAGEVLQANVPAVPLFPEPQSSLAAGVEICERCECGEPESHSDLSEPVNLVIKATGIRYRCHKTWQHAVEASTRAKHAERLATEGAAQGPSRRSSSSLV